MLHKINYTTILILLCLSALSKAQSTAEEKAILKVVNDEVTAIMARDYDKWASTMAHKPYTSSFWGGFNNYNHAEGWEDLSQNMKNLFHNNSPLPHHHLLKMLSLPSMEIWLR